MMAAAKTAIRETPRARSPDFRSELAARGNPAGTTNPRPTRNMLTRTLGPVVLALVGFVLVTGTVAEMAYRAWKWPA